MALRTRMLKACCGDCAYTVRVTRKWLDEAGAPLCPDRRCRGYGRELECAEYMELLEAAGDLAETDAAHSPIRETWIQGIRSVQECARCTSELFHGEPALKKVFRVGGEFFSTYTCQRCTERVHACRATA